MVDEGSNIGCVCTPPAADGWNACPKEAPDFYTAMPKPNLKFDGKKYCSLECRYDDDCGTDGQWCFRFSDGKSSVCVWDLMADGTCNVSGRSFLHNMDASIGIPNQHSEGAVLI